jgi:hypothetical protein
MGAEQQDLLGRGVALLPFFLFTLECIKSLLFWLLLVILRYVVDSGGQSTFVAILRSWQISSRAA